MKTIKSILLYTTSILILWSCSSEFLDTKPTEFLEDRDLEYTGKINPEIYQGTIRGIYNLMISSNAGGTGSHEDFGHKSFDLMGDLLTSDMALIRGSYNRWVNFTNLKQTVDFTQNIPNYMGWRYFYKVINAANEIIEKAGGNDFTPTKDNEKLIIGQAKAMRAYGYFYLSQFYINEYDPNIDAFPMPIVPSIKALKKSKLSDIYNLMISDLKQAISYLSAERANITQVNKDVAKALLAYVYASMGESSKNLLAKKLADEIIASGRYQLMNSKEVTGGFTSVDTPGWMWGFDITTSNNLDLISWYGMMDFFTYGYQGAGNFKGIDDVLYSKINDKDIRKKQFDKDYLLMPVNKFYNLKRKRLGQRTIEDDYVFMRVAEMYLLSAEMAALEGLDSEAKDRLNELLKDRFKDVADYNYVNGLSGKKLLDEIIFQTRIELWGEGKSYLLMKRRKLNTTRGNNHIYFKGQSFNYNDDRLTFEIPLKELQNNPYIN